MNMALEYFENKEVDRILSAMRKILNDLNRWHGVNTIREQIQREKKLNDNLARKAEIEEDLEKLLSQKFTQEIDKDINSLLEEMKGIEEFLAIYNPVPPSPSQKMPYDGSLPQNNPITNPQNFAKKPPTPDEKRKMSQLAVQCFNMNVWLTKDKRQIHIKNMDDHHLDTTIKYIGRQLDGGNPMCIWGLGKAWLKKLIAEEQSRKANVNSFMKNKPAFNR